MAHRLLLYQHLEIQVKKIVLLKEVLLYPAFIDVCYIHLEHLSVLSGSLALLLSAPYQGYNSAHYVRCCSRLCVCCGVELYEKCIRPGNYSFAREAAYQSAKRLPFSYHRAATNPEGISVVTASSTSVSFDVFSTAPVMLPVMLPEPWVSEHRGHRL